MRENKRREKHFESYKLTEKIKTSAEEEENFSLGQKCKQANVKLVFYNGSLRRDVFFFLVKQKKVKTKKQQNEKTTHIFPKLVGKKVTMSTRCFYYHLFTI